MEEYIEMENNLRVIIGLVIIISMVFSGVVINWTFEKKFNTLYRNGEIIAREYFVVEAERTYFNLNSWYAKNVKCPKIEAAGGHRTATRCYYPKDYYEQLSRSLINTKISFVNDSDYLTIFKNTPFYKYGTRGSYAGKLIEKFDFNKLSNNVEEFPEKYFITWTPKDTRNYRVIWRVENLKDVNMNEGDYTACRYTFGYTQIDLKDECKKLEKAEVKGNRIWFYFKPERGIQEFDLGLVDPPSDNVTIFLDGIARDRLYEFETMVNITANCSMSPPDDCTVCINLTAPNEAQANCGTNSTSYLYNITLLRQDKFNSSLNSKTLVGSSCFQEQANESTSCGGLDTGVYSVPAADVALWDGDGGKVFDSDYSTGDNGVQNQA